MNKDITNSLDKRLGAVLGTGTSQPRKGWGNRETGGDLLNGDFDLRDEENSRLESEVMFDSRDPSIVNRDDPSEVVLASFLSSQEQAQIVSEDDEKD